MPEVKVLDLVAASNSSGLLSAAQFPDQLPFLPERIFIVTGAPAGAERGGHAHYECHQLLIVTAGIVIVDFDDSGGTFQVSLTGSTQALYIPPLVWAKQTYATEGATLVVLASHKYDQADYLDDRAEASRLRDV